MLKYTKASTDWFAASLGVSVHWTTTTRPFTGTAKNYQDAVSNFDLNGFIDQLSRADAKHLIFTITHGQQYLACPHPILDSLLSGRTCQRDLLGELAQLLQLNGIKLIFYYNHSCNGDDDLEWKKAVGYMDVPLDLFSGRIMSIVEYLSRRYGKLISGWWFDSSYSLDPRGPYNTVTTEMGDWRFPWEALTAAAKMGNPESIVAYNSGVDFNYLYTEIKIPCEFAKESGYYPTVVKVFDKNGRMVEVRNTPFVVTERFEHVDDGYGIQCSSGGVPVEALRRVGITWLRKNTLFWRFAENKGPVPFDPTKMPVEAQEEHKLKTIGTIELNAPVWASDNGSSWTGDFSKLHGFLDRVGHTQRLKNDVFELQNEPDITLPRKDKDFNQMCEYYAQLVKECGSVLKKYGVPVGIDISGVDSGYVVAERVFQLAGDKFDYFLVHPYSWPRELHDDNRGCSNPETGGYYANLKRGAALIKKYGSKHQLAIGELGWALSIDSDYNSVNSRRFAAYLARVVILAKTFHDLKFISWYAMVEHFEGGRFDYAIWRNDYGPRPLPSVAAYAQVIHAFNGMTGVAQEVLDGDIWLVRWAKGNHDCFAIWTTDEKREPIQLKVSNAEIRNIFGTPVKGGEFEVSELPVYLSADKGAGEKVFKEILDGIENKIPLQMTASMCRDDLIRLHVRNNLPTEWKGVLKIADSSVSVALAAKETKSVCFPLKAKQHPGKEMVFDVVICGEKTTKNFKIPITLPKTIAIPKINVADLKTYDFLKEKSLIVLNTRRDVYPPDPSIKWSGPEDLSGKFFFGWDNKNFYIMAEVTDDEHTNPFEGKDIWAGDCIQFAFDTENDAVVNSGYDNNDYEFGVALGKMAWCWQAAPGRNTGEAKDVAQYITRSGNQTLYRIAVPWSIIPPMKAEKGRVFGFSLGVKDKDGEIANRYLTFGDGIMSGKNPFRFKKLMLTD